jgi:hypothetical protein
MDDQDFIPKGAIAFLFTLMGFYVVIWLGLYILMIGRM